MNLISFTKILLLPAFLLVVHVSLGQGQGQGSTNANQQWKTNGNQATFNEWLGTSNSTDLILKTNSIERVRIKQDGSIIMSDLVGDGEIITDPDGGGTDPGSGNSSGGRGLVGADSLGKLHKFSFSGIQNQVLTGRGAFSNIKNLAGWERTSGKIISMTGENIGVDVVNPTEKLEVNGNIKISGSIIAPEGLQFSNENGISFTNADGQNIFSYGKGTPKPAPIICAAQPSSAYIHNFAGILQIYNADAGGNYVQGGGLLNLQTWKDGSSIDASIGGNEGTGGLMLNYFCHNNTHINTGGNLQAGIDGGTVYMGEKVDMKKHLKIGWKEDNEIDLNTSIEVNQNDNNSNVLKLNTWNQSVKFLSIDLLHSDLSITNPFTVYANGKTYIGEKNQKKSNHSDAQLTVYGKIVATSCYITLDNWADYVFADNYHLPKLSEVESYYKLNKRLPEIPSEKEIIENGVDLAEMNKLLLKKIEELTIYLVELDKELESFKNEVESIKGSLKK